MRRYEFTFIQAPASQKGDIATTPATTTGASEAYCNGEKVGTAMVREGSYDAISVACPAMDAAAKLVVKLVLAL
jgi:hypothetical protein